ncbi:hypothetical protein PXH69_21535 [Rhodococcus qingshengii]|uniref:Uncharacterized protein n=1 Tax=Rhodococcus qingshengii TaxID=334542 RepID=A0AAW6LQH0_RHOSG|nr:hypothetical protein [Rhodococcus qingshengii]MDE8647560.1 hypothetical protein [Rhodococcus qingshengii]
MSDPDFTVTRTDLAKIVDKRDIEAAQTWTHGGTAVAIVHHGDTRPDVLTSDLAEIIYENLNGLGDKRRSGDVVADFTQIIADLEPVTDDKFDGTYITYWRNVGILA